MDSDFIDKKALKRKNREATIKHYILGYILECAVKNDVNVTVSIRRLLVYDLKIITVDMFIECLRKAKANRFFGIKGTKRSYKAFKKQIELINYEKKGQIKIIRKLQEFAEKYENGIFVNSRMIQSSFVGIKPNYLN